MDLLVRAYGKRKEGHCRILIHTIKIQDKKALRYNILRDQNRKIISIAFIIIKFDLYTREVLYIGY